MAWDLVWEHWSELFAGPELDNSRCFAFDPTPVRNQFRTVRLPDADRYWLAVGRGYKGTADLRFDAAYVHIFAGNALINEVSQTGDLLVGRSSDHIDIVSLSAVLRF